jgi:hypothetical protein
MAYAIDTKRTCISFHKMCESFGMSHRDLWSAMVSVLPQLKWMRKYYV